MNKLLTFFTSLLLLSGCALTGGQESTVTTGLFGGAAGAGIGALAGSIISNGDIAMSAALGAGIGIPTAIVAEAAYSRYQKYSEAAEKAEVVDDILENERILRRNEQLLDELRNGMDDTVTRGNYGSEGEFIYTGPTIGTIR